MKMKLHQPGKTMRGTGICDMRDHRTLELGMGDLVEIRTFEASLTQREGGEEKRWRGEDSLCVWVVVEGGTGGRMTLYFI